MPELIFAANWFMDNFSSKIKTGKLYFDHLCWDKTRDGAGKLQLQGMGSQGKLERSHV